MPALLRGLGGAGCVCVGGCSWLLGASQATGREGGGLLVCRALDAPGRWPRFAVRKTLHADRTGATTRHPK